MKPLSIFLAVGLLVASLFLPPACAIKSKKWNLMGEVGGVSVYFSSRKQKDLEIIDWRVVNNNNHSVDISPLTKTYTFEKEVPEEISLFFTLKPRETKESSDGSELQDVFYKKKILSIEVFLGVEKDIGDAPPLSSA